ncbi:DUF4373 domain-containing protein [uncultured Enterococcus sp.]|uniref:DUF4373 domain-containing protein n=1 Tax=uncultured Enterococcus sp. TaxID=167972 RepID=UPI002AA729A7|nr:DUF4373 domain-containing protein [uncultured Enterococcus sp.]
MARPTKKGITYFPLDVDFFSDIKVRKIIRANGADSVSILISLLCSIYREGYYIEWDNDTAFLISDEIGVSEGSVTETVRKATQIGFFNKELFDRCSILTSKGIQERYKTITYQRKNNDIKKEFNLLVENTPIDEPSGNETSPQVSFSHEKHIHGSDNHAEGTQSKVNKSKVNKSKKNSRKSKTYDELSEHYQLADYLFKKILVNNPEAKQPNLQKWADDIRLAIERDKRSPEKLKNMIDWCQSHNFWSGVILSTAKLREKYDQMAAQANSQVQKPVTRQEKLPDWVGNPIPEEKLSAEKQAEIDRQMEEFLSRRGGE